METTHKFKSVKRVFGESRLIHAPSFFVGGVNNELAGVQDLQFGRDELSDLFSDLKFWLKDFVDLSDFPHVYPQGGIIGAINYSVAELGHRSIYTLPGEFPYIKELYPNSITLEPAIMNKGKLSDSVFYLSYPSCLDGSVLKDLEQLAELFSEVWIDLAYVGTQFQPIRLIPPENTTRIFFSMSKAFGMGAQRCGFLFSNGPLELLQTLVEKKYFSSYAMRCAEHVIKGYPLQTAKIFFEAAYHQACKKYDLQKTNTYLIAKTQRSEFDFWKNEELGCNRIPMGRVIENEPFK